MKYALTCGLLLCTAASAAAEPSVTIRLNGPAANRVGVTILGDGYTQAEIARMLGVPAGTVASWLSRSKALLRARLREVT